jgi:hypothetical protein
MACPKARDYARMKVTMVRLQQGFAPSKMGFQVKLQGNNLSRQCPLWVMSGHQGSFDRCPLYPRKRTLQSAIGISAKCRKRTHALSK